MQLSPIFRRAEKWNAVLLLDEADVFLEQRSCHDVHRNALVSIFLRELEYYQGIMFLTINRVKHRPAWFERSAIDLLHGYNSIQRQGRGSLYVRIQHCRHGRSQEIDVE